MDRVTKPERRRAVLTGPPGQGLLKKKFLSVPGACGAGNAKGPPLFLSLGVKAQKVIGMGMGVTGHEKKHISFGFNCTPKPGF
jgi:hypothetical protein